MKTGAPGPRQILDRGEDGDIANHQEGGYMPSSTGRRTILISGFNVHRRTEDVQRPCRASCGAAIGIWREVSGSSQVFVVVKPGATDGELVYGT